MRTAKCLVPVVFAACSVYGAPITGSLWVVSDATAQNAVFSNIPLTAPDVTFDVNSPLNFTTAGSRTTFLNSGGAFNIVGSPGVLASSISPSLIEFTGMVTVTNGQGFAVGHDDGLTLDIGGVTVIDAPGPTGPTVTTRTYSGPSGTFPFRLVYGECCGGAAVLRVGLPFQPTPQTSTPEPATLAMTATGLLLAAVRVGRRRRS